MQYSLYAFIPFGFLFGIALIAALISFWPKARRRKVETVSNKPRRSAEIIAFPGRREQVSAMPAARSYRKG
jgi:hypothetical protein